LIETLLSIIKTLKPLIVDVLETDSNTYLNYKLVHDLILFFSICWLLETISLKNTDIISALISAKGAKAIKKEVPHVYFEF
jgi:hypothetical protein